MIKSNSKTVSVKIYNPKKNKVEDQLECETLINSHDLYKKANTLYIFPSWIKHLVKPNMSDEERISISFNVA